MIVNFQEVNILVEHVKMLARSFIRSDIDFIRLQKKIEEIKTIFLMQIQTQRQNQQLIKSIIEVGSVRSKVMDSRSTKHNKGHHQISSFRQSNNNFDFHKIVQIDNKQSQNDQYKQNQQSIINKQILQNQSQKLGPLTQKMEFENELTKWIDQESSSLMRDTGDTFKNEYNNIYYPISLLKKFNTQIQLRRNNKLSNTSQGFGKVRFKTQYKDPNND